MTIVIDDYYDDENLIKHWCWLSGKSPRPLLLGRQRWIFFDGNGKMEMMAMINKAMIATMEIMATIKMRMMKI